MTHTTRYPPPNATPHTTTTRPINPRRKPRDPQARTEIHNQAPIQSPPPDPLEPLHRALADNPADIQSLAEAAHIDIPTLAAAIAQRPTRAWREALGALLDACAHLAARHARAHAIARLRELADSNEHPETARKACLDLAKLPAEFAKHADTGTTTDTANNSSNNRAAPDTLHPHPTALTPKHEKAIQQLLEQLARPLRAVPHTNP
ncbi:MAG: hypothetical protein ACTS3F_10255 [Phycisphaerales bacterium]